MGAKMRLTLRTLLAYLDNTLEPMDAETLREKIAESGFAGQLVQRIRSNLTNPALSAPAPDAVAPVEEANVIAEYLDSTLSAEQISEIERACLESDQQLAEAAACHQILTLVLGKSAEVSPELRQRIYALPERDIADIATAGSFASVSVPVGDANAASQHNLDLHSPSEPSELDALHAAATQSSTAHPGGVVQPVGPGDSGVSDAPTRIRQSDDQARTNQPSAREGTMAGSRPRSALEAAQMYGGSIRTSRIAPWLVSLALAGILLFALVRIFEPLLNGSTASKSDSQVTWTDVEASERSVPGDPIAVPAEPLEQATVETRQNVPKDKTTDDVVANAPPKPTPSDNKVVTENPATPPLPPLAPSTEMTTVTPEQPSTRETPDSNVAVTGPDLPPQQDKVMEPAPTPDVAPSPAPAATPAPAKTDGSAEVAPPAKEPMTEKGDTNADTVPTSPPTETATEQPPTNGAMEDPKSLDAAPAKQPRMDIAKLTSQSGLVFAISDDAAPVQIRQNAVVTAGQTVVCAPTYRVRLDTVDNMAVTLVGPAKVRWTAETDEKPVLHVEFGRILLEAIKPGATINVVVEDHSLELAFADVESLVAMTLAHFRAPGFDPLQKENHITTLGLVVAQGKLGLRDGENEIELTTGQQWVRRGSEAAVVSESNTALDWITPPDPNEQSLESSAREALLGLMVAERPVEISLREATMFRRSEVGALAARTLLALGRSDVFFGGDGMLSKADQRSYWSDQFAALQTEIDRNADAAEKVFEAIQRMDSANAKILFQLLTGYSQRQLAEGGDEELVRNLDSPSMSVRALALENLHKITGVTLSFRPEQDNAARRGQAIKKWEARQRKGDIRWAQP